MIEMLIFYARLGLNEFEEVLMSLRFVAAMTTVRAEEEEWLMDERSQGRESMAVQA